MLHLQSPALNWPQSLPLMGAGTVNKFFQTEACSEAKALRPDCKTIKRHYVDHQGAYLQNPNKEQAARDFFATFVDGTFRQHAANIDYIESLNEIYAPDATTQANSALWDIAALKVWKTEYRIDPAYQHIKLIAANIAVGNDAPVSVAAACVQYDGVMGYHAYIPVRYKAILPDEYQHYSGRWETLDAQYRAAGHSVKWMFTETGAVGYSTPGAHLSPDAGWLHPDVYAGDFAAWLEMWQYWLSKVKVWNSANGNRVLGWQVFTSNQNAGGVWRWFELQQPRMNELATFFKTFVPTAPPPPPPSGGVNAALIAKSLELQCIQLNSAAALQAKIVRDGRQPVGSEGRLTHQGVNYALQPAESLTSQGRWVYYCRAGDWGNVKVITG